MIFWISNLYKGPLDDLKDSGQPRDRSTYSCWVTYHWLYVNKTSPVLPALLCIFYCNLCPWCLGLARAVKDLWGFWRNNTCMWNLLFFHLKKCDHFSFSKNEKKSMLQYTIKVLKASRSEIFFAVSLGGKEDTGWVWRKAIRPNSIPRLRNPVDHENP